MCPRPPPPPSAACCRPRPPCAGPRRRRAAPRAQRRACAQPPLVRHGERAETPLRRPSLTRREPRKRLRCGHRPWWRWARRGRRAAAWSPRGGLRGRREAEPVSPPCACATGGGEGRSRRAGEGAKVERHAAFPIGAGLEQVPAERRAHQRSRALVVDAWEKCGERCEASVAPHTPTYPRTSQGTPFGSAPHSRSAHTAAPSPSSAAATSSEAVSSALSEETPDPRAADQRGVAPVESG